jgi:hypothetical protein
MKRLLSRLLLTAMVGATVGVVAGGQAAQAAINCPPDIINKTVQTDVNVPAGTTCTIQNSTVVGSVTVQPGAALNIFGSTIQGSVTATNPGLIQIDALAPCTTPDPSSCARLTRIVGSVTINGAIAGGNYICNGTRIGGDLAILNSGPGSSWEIGSPRCTHGANTITGSVTVTGNQNSVLFDNNKVGGSGEFTGNTGGGEVINNKFGGSLTVRNNTPCYTVSGNTAPGGTTVSCP